MGISLIALALLSMLWVLRQWTNMSRRRAFVSLIISLASGWTIALACVQGLAWREGVFLRTPKNDRNQKVVRRVRDALWLACWETILAGGLFVCAGLLVASSSKHILLVVMITVQACVFLCAPVTAFWNVRAQMVPAVERRASLRQQERRSVVGGDRSSARVSRWRCWRWSERSSSHPSPPRVSCSPGEPRSASRRRRG